MVAIYTKKSGIDRFKRIDTTKKLYLSTKDNSHFNHVLCYCDHDVVALPS